MLIVKKIFKTEEGYDSLWSVSEEQMQFLLTYAINTLLVQGLVEVEEQETNENQAQLDFLEETDKERMHQA
jgi:hypothetical protein